MVWATNPESFGLAPPTGSEEERCEELPDRLLPEEFPLDRDVFADEGAQLSHETHFQ